MAFSVKDIQDDKFSGSFEIGQNALLVLKDFVKNNNQESPEKFVEELNNLGKEIMKAQPNMVIIRKKVSTIIYHVKRLVKTTKSIEEIKSACETKIDEVIKLSEAIKKKIGATGANLIFNQSKILTISSSALIKEILLSAKKIKRKFTVYCLESRPKNEGHRLAADLVEAGIPCVLATDVMMGQLLNEVNMVLCGADRIFESGFVNKTGTLPLSIVASSKQIPFYVAAETDKVLKEIDRSLRFYPQDPDEVIKSKNSLLTVSNYYFESIPFDYVSKIICEDGVFNVSEFESWYLKD